MQCLLAHPAIRGAEEEAHIGDASAPRPISTNENPGVMFDAFRTGDYSGLKKLIDYYAIADGEALCLKAPGYVFAQSFFKNNPFDYVPFFVWVRRDAARTVFANIKYPAGAEMLTRSLPYTDCPPDLHEKYRQLWETGDQFVRAYLRRHWHDRFILNTTGLVLDTEAFENKNGLLNARISGYLGIPEQAEVQKMLDTYKMESLDRRTLNKINKIIAGITI
jgi:hypothetical protein